VKDAGARYRRPRLRLVFIDRIRYQQPQPQRDERDRDHRAQHVRPEPLRHRRPQRCGAGVIDERGKENRRTDRPRRAVTPGEYEREELRLVADFGEGDEPGGGEKGFHRLAVKGGVSRIIAAHLL